MRKTAYLAIILLAALPAGAQQVLQDSFSKLSLHYDTPPVKVDAATLGNGKYLTVGIDGYIEGGEIGSPSVPVLPNTMVIPFCDGMQVLVENVTYDTIDLDRGLPLYPTQPGRSKSDTSYHEPIVDSIAYRTDAFPRTPLATIQEIGIARDRRLAVLTYSPIRINPVAMKAIVCRSADITVLYTNPDSAATVDHYMRYHSSAFTSGPTLNRLFSPATKGTSSILRMAIVAPSGLRSYRLEQFVKWKQRQGMMVDIIYHDEQGLNSNTAIANYLKGLYTNATAEAPAPTFLIIVGDCGQTPVFSSSIIPYSYYGLTNDHITDLYYATWSTGDNLPDCYQGRFSASDTVTLARIISKTILYESYSFEDDSYLERAVLVSGIDQGYSGDNAYNYSDPSMDYAAKYYIRSSSGYKNVYYYKNLYSFAPQGVTVTGSSKTDTIAAWLRKLYNTGIGWINYTAHGNWDNWSTPRFSVSNAEAMSNTGMPSFVIGNCCLSNKFDRSVCLGEAFLRRGDNAGAAAYIGATNSTYWSEDFYWSVGVRNNISGTMDATYDASNLGAYDCLFHTHNEPTNKRAATAGSFVMQGNMAVNSTVSTSWGRYVVPYYWEIYELMGDPSLMPWLGRAKTLTLNIDTTSRPIRVSTVSHAYVAIIDSSTLQVLSAATTNADGIAILNLSDTVSLSSIFFSVTAQGYKPYMEGCENINLGINDPVKTYPNPTADGLVTVTGTGLRNIEVYDFSGHLVKTVTPSADVCQLDLKALQPGIYILLVDTSDGPVGKKVIIR